jgi:hypothetical protein
LTAFVNQSPVIALDVPQHEALLPHRAQHSRDKIFLNFAKRAIPPV